MRAAPTHPAPPENTCAGLARPRLPTRPALKPNASHMQRPHTLETHEDGSADARAKRPPPERRTSGPSQPPTPASICAAAASTTSPAFTPTCPRPPATAPAASPRPRRPSSHHFQPFSLRRPRNTSSYHHPSRSAQNLAGGHELELPHSATSILTTSVHSFGRAVQDRTGHAAPRSSA